MKIIYSRMMEYIQFSCFSIFKKFQNFSWIFPRCINSSTIVGCHGNIWGPVKVYEMERKLNLYLGSMPQLTCWGALLLVDDVDDEAAWDEDQFLLQRRGTIFVYVSVPFFTLHETVLVTGCGQKSLSRNVTNLKLTILNGCYFLFSFHRRSTRRSEQKMGFQLMFTVML